MKFFIFLALLLLAPVSARAQDLSTMVTGLVGDCTAVGPGTAVIRCNNLSGPATTTGNVSVLSGSFGLSGPISAPAWTTAGIRYKNVTATLTDTTSIGTVANARTDNFGGNTIAASSATTFTNYFSAYFTNPVAGTNVTMTNKSAIGADSISIGGAAQGANALAVTGTVSATAYKAGATAGVSCSGSPTAGFTTVNGIVTAC